MAILCIPGNPSGSFTKKSPFLREEILYSNANTNHRMMTPSDIAKVFEVLKLDTEDRRKSFLYIGSQQSKTRPHTIIHTGGSNVTHSISEDIVDAKLE